MGHMKFINMLIKGGDYKDFEESYLKANKDKQETFIHNEQEFKTHYGKAVCELVKMTLTG
tara:strand:+ start:218 stop:397 length:180 start_codon:yes stop_codon:yes gene_type:complete